jgi:hypothetical protein
VADLDQTKANAVRLFRGSSKDDAKIAGLVGATKGQVGRWRMAWILADRPASLPGDLAGESAEEAIERIRQTSEAEARQAGEEADPYLLQARKMLRKSSREMREERLADLLRALDAATSDTARNQIQGRIDKLRAEAQDDQADEVDPLHDMDDDELVVALRLVAQDLPEHLLEPVAEELLDRLDPAWVRLQLPELKPA